MGKNAVTLYVVADGGHARLIKGTGSEGPLVEISTFDAPHVHVAAGDMKSDRPGRSQESVGGARHAIEGTDPRRVAAAHFAQTVAERIGELSGEEAFDRLVLVAPNHFLAEVEAHLSTGLKEKLAGVLAKDLAKVPVSDLVAHFAGIAKLDQV